jgi:UDP-GlcNAc:undecaprenyl-phosphate GlcNAc-1-phosphate transferase
VMIESADTKVLLLLAFMATIMGGLLGLVVLLMLYLLSNLALGKDQKNKHGIGEEVSRFGGIAIFLGVLAYFISRSLWFEDGVHGALVENFCGYEPFALVVGVVGLCEDCKFSIKPRTRLFLAVIATVIVALSNPELIPKRVEFWFADDFFNHPTLLFMGVVIIVVGFINAGNISDGANGLLAINAMSVFVLMYLQASSVLYFSLLVSLGVFSMYNILSGRIFLGDFGSYTLSALMALCCLDLYVSTNASAWFFASLLSYPCTEIVRVMINRALKHKSPFSADNSHVHNKLYEAINRKGLNTLAANSLTGILLGVCFSVVPVTLAVTGLLSWEEEIWGIYFLFSVLVHLLLSRIKVSVTDPQTI